MCRFLLILILFFTVLPIAAQEKTNLELISFSNHEQPFSDIIDSIREQTGKNIIYTDEIKTIPVTTRLVQIHWRKVLDIIAKEHDCIIEELDLGVIKISKPVKISMEFDEADIRDVIDRVAAIANVNIIISAQVKGTVTIRLQEVPWLEALTAIVKNRGYKIVEQTSGRILRVMPINEVPPQLETEIFRLRYIRPKSRYVACVRCFDSYFYAKEKKQVTNKPRATRLLDILNATITPGAGQITYDDGTNTLVITDKKSKLDKMKEIIKTLDVEPKQIFIDIKCVKTTNNDIFKLGLGFAEPGTNKSFEQFTRLPFQLGKNGSKDEEALATKAKSAAKNINTIRPGILNPTEMTVVVKLLETDSTIKLIQAPKIVTTEDSEATVVIGDAVFWKKTVEGDRGTVSVSLIEPDPNPIAEGQVEMVLAPSVIEGNKIYLQISVFGIMTQVVLQNGQTAVVPFLHHLFEPDDKEENLFIFCTPRIVKSGEDISTELKATIDGKAQKSKYDEIWEESGK